MSELMLPHTHSERYGRLEDHLYGWTDSERISRLDANLWFFREPKQAGHIELNRILIESAVSQYGEGLISLGRAAEIARLPYEKMIDALQTRGVSIRFGPESIGEAEAERRDLLEQFRRARRRH